jgi:hypothetical protein
MNPLSSKDPVDARPGEAAPVGDFDCAVTYSDAAFYELDAWFDLEVEALETRFRDFMTGHSQRRSFGR